MGELITRATIWVAMGLWCGAMLLPRPDGFLNRWVRSVALASYLVHIGCAYQFFYQWSHRVAWEATARDTEATAGLDTGFGLVVNFVFAAVLLVDLVLPFRVGRKSRGPWIDGLTVFMILNGAVVFGEGTVRIYGLTLSGLVFAAWVHRSRILSRDTELS